MELIAERTYWCCACNQATRIRDGERPVELRADQSGGPHVQIVTVAGVEVHRCVLVDAPRSVRL